MQGNTAASRMQLWQDVIGSTRSHFKRKSSFHVIPTTAGRRNPARRALR